ncbi:MAG: GFA family protein [Deltaproteobacteria bacterium]|jgi:hypothetical protein|nr:GFA family protein [Deltaproteobacteria bacterium]
MSKNQTGRGSCLCGSIHFTAATMGRSHGACHCAMCRKWSGGPLMSVFCGSDVTFESEEFIGVYESSQWAERGFCKKCGSALFYRVKGNQTYHIPIGLFDEFEEITFGIQIFIDKKPEHYSFANETETMTEAQVFEHYGPSA